MKFKSCSYQVISRLIVFLISSYECKEKMRESSSVSNDLRRNALHSGQFDSCKPELIRSFVYFIKSNVDGARK